MQHPVVLQMQKLDLLLAKVVNRKINLKSAATGNYYDFKDHQADQICHQIGAAIASLKRQKAALSSLVMKKQENEKEAMKSLQLLGVLETALKNGDVLTMASATQGLLSRIQTGDLQEEQDKAPPTLQLTLVPEEIRKEMESDAKELEKCFRAECYKSCAILCGRMLETALHRKYYEETGQDLLEKSPGIGLGNLVAKLSEKEIFDDPGITQQIHLINQIRIFSVHKKKVPFNPNKNQVQAMILYTLDILNRLFSRRRS